MQPSAARPEKKRVPGPALEHGRELIPDGSASTSPSAQELRTSRVVLFFMLSFCFVTPILLALLAYWLFGELLKLLF